VASSSCDPYILPMRIKAARAVCLLAGLLLAAAGGSFAEAQPALKEYPVPAGSHPHDVAPAPDGRVWYTAQYAGALGWIDPATGAGGRIPLGPGSRPHGVILGPDGNPWVTDGGLNAVLRVEAATGAVTRFPLPAGSPEADLNTAAFDARGTLWFTGQRGYYGSVEPQSGRVRLFDAPRGRGPYGIAAARAGGSDGFLYFASLAAGYLGRIDAATGQVRVLEPPGRGQGTRRVWPDSRGLLWVSGWYSGNLLRYDPQADAWQEIRLPGQRPQPYGVYVDERDFVWISDWGARAILRYDPRSGRFDTFKLARGDVRQLLGRPGEVWGAESGADRLVVIRF
jgi:virginiamycin B lyase